MAITLTREQFKERYGQEGLDLFKPATPEVKQSWGQETLQDIKQTGSALKQTFNETKGKIGKIAEREVAGGQGKLRSFGQAFGAVAGGISRGIGNIITGGVKSVLTEGGEEKVKESMASGIEKVMPVAQKIDETLGRPVGSFIEKYQNLDEKSKADVDALLGISAFAADIAGGGFGKKAVQKGATTGVETLSRGGRAVAGALDEPVTAISKSLDEIAPKAKQLLASEPDEKVKTILKNSPAEKLDEYISIAEKHSISQEAVSGFEKVADYAQDALNQIKKQMSSIGKQKESIIQKAKVGLEEFKDAPRRAILEVSKLEKNNLTKGIIEKLKLVKTKLDADKAIDEIQDLLYTGTQNLTLAKGSAMEKQLQGIVGRLNNELKDSLPEAYRKLNTQFANRIKVAKTLNRALGEVVEGVPTRGASLIKQFFSPAGTKAKELFAFIKKNTGIDLAQEATLAKFAEELFDNPEVRSLLQGLPMTKRGVVDKVLDFTVEKTGIGKKLQETLRKGTIERAKEFTK